jgi:diguanylate cyclase (GGDEF)-like protein
MKQTPSQAFPDLSSYQISDEIENHISLLKKINLAVLNAKKTNTKIAVLAIDLDNFKKINLSYDYETGDQLLNAVASRLRLIVTTHDTVVRIGGEEAVIILTNLAPEQDIINRIGLILDKISEIYIIQNKPLYITASIGIGIYPDNGQDATTILKSADCALSQVKKHGGNNYQFLEQLNPDFPQKIDLEYDIHQALKNDEFIMQYQPIINLQTNQLSRFEALVRWRKSPHIIVYPDEFLSDAEEFTLMNPIAKLVIEKVMLQIHRLEANKIKNFNTAINFSASQLNINNINFLKQKIEEYGVLSENLYIELTEKTLIELSKTYSIFKKLQEMKIKLSLDDFGMGYSSLSYLKNFPVDNLKIDKVFIQGIPHNHIYVSIVSAILALAASLNINVTAEGIENADQLEFLKNNGCHEGQGYFLSKPLFDHELVSYIEKMDNL